MRCNPMSGNELRNALSANKLRNRLQTSDDRSTDGRNRTETGPKVLSIYRPDAMLEVLLERVTSASASTTFDKISQYI
jgi:hypothetical protein